MTSQRWCYTFTSHQRHFDVIHPLRYGSKLLVFWKMVWKVTKINNKNRNRHIPVPSFVLTAKQGIPGRFFFIRWFFHMGHSSKHHNQYLNTLHKYIPPITPSSHLSSPTTFMLEALAEVNKTYKTLKLTTILPITYILWGSWFGVFYMHFWRNFNLLCFQLNNMTSRFPPISTDVCWIPGL